MITDRFALQAWGKAESRLAEALVLQPETAPSAVAHMAYYAMFHAARVVLLRATGRAPKKHSSVIGQFGLIARERSAALKQAAHDPHEVEEIRIIADYDEVRTVSVEKARDAINRAVAFFHVCAEEFGFPRPETPSDG